MSHFYAGGFVPSTVDENMNRLRQALAQQFNIHFNDEKEWIGSNLYQLFLGFATLKIDLEVEWVQVLKSFFEYIQKAYEGMSHVHSGTYEGFQQALMEIAQGVFFQTTDKDPQLLPGVCLIAIDPLPSITKTNDWEIKIAAIFKRYFPIGIVTKDEKHLPTYKTEVIHDNGVKEAYYYEKVKPVPLQIKIRYRLLENALFDPKASVKNIKKAFQESFEKVQKIGLAFEPFRYLSTQNLDFLAECSVWAKRVDSKKEFTKEPIHAAYHEKFTLHYQDSLNEEPDIDVIPIKNEDDANKKPLPEKELL